MQAGFNAGGGALAALRAFLLSHGQPHGQAQGPQIRPTPGPAPTRDTDPILDGGGMPPEPQPGMGAGLGHLAPGAQMEPELPPSWDTPQMGVPQHALAGGDEENPLARLFALLHPKHRPGVHGPMSHAPSRPIAR